MLGFLFHLIIYYLFYLHRCFFSYLSTVCQLHFFSCVLNLMAHSYLAIGHLVLQFNTHLSSEHFHRSYFSSHNSQIIVLNHKFLSSSVFFLKGSRKMILKYRKKEWYLDYLLLLLCEGVFLWGCWRRWTDGWMAASVPTEA